MVAVGNLDSVWLAVPEDVSADELQEAFQGFFGAKWADVLDTADQSFAYNAANNAYLAVRDLHLIGDLTLEQLLETKAVNRPPNIIVS
jgi:hypothetical protein